MPRNYKVKHSSLPSPASRPRRFCKAVYSLRLHLPGPGDGSQQSSGRPRNSRERRRRCSSALASPSS
eukprot:6975308-Alexandrium_andersonii.AAC.1